MRNKKLVIYYGSTVIKYNENYYAKPGLGRFIEEISKKYEEVIYCAPIQDDKNNQHLDLYKISSDNIDYQELNSGGSFIKSILKKRKITKQIKLYSKSWNNADIYLRWPTPFIYEVFKLSNKNSNRVLLHIVGDTKEIINSSGKYVGVLKILANLYINFEEKKIKRIMKWNKTLINGNGLKRLYYGKNYNVEEIISATLSKKEILEPIYVRKQYEEIKIISVGELKKEKGIIYLLQAVNDLKQQNYKINLNIIGDGPERKKLEDYVSENDLDSIVTFHGYVPLGEKLYNHYKNANIFVLPSISEGTPRVLLEAMAFRLPIIATNVGGVAYTIKNKVNGFLVESKNYKEISEKVIYIKNNEKLLSDLVNRSYDFAKQNTIESFVNKIYESFKE